jgi:hypothetical protein
MLYLYGRMFYAIERRTKLEVDQPAHASSRCNSVRSTRLTIANHENHHLADDRLQVHLGGDASAATNNDITPNSSFRVPKNQFCKNRNKQLSGVVSASKKYEVDARDERKRSNGNDAEDDDGSESPDSFSAVHHHGLPSPVIRYTKKCQKVRVILVI